MSRFASRWADNDPARTRVALTILLCLRGTPVLYQGDEIGLGDTELQQDDLRDPLGVRFWPYYSGRDGMRTPMPWRNVPGGGFTEAGVRPWLPFGDLAACNVEDQQSDPGSMLHLARDLIALRRAIPDLQFGSYRSRDAAAGTWVWNRGDGVVVAANMTEGSGVVEGVSGTIKLGTVRGRDGTSVRGSLRLEGWEAVVVELGQDPS
jgi:alpha-glucosidase